MGRSEVTTSVVKFSEDLSNRVFIIIRKYVDQMKFAALMAVRFITFLIFFCFYFVSVCMVVHFVCFC
jgi:hypothetical protein